MTGTSRVTLAWSTVVAGAVTLVAFGAAVVYVVGRAGLHPPAVQIEQAPVSRPATVQDQPGPTAAGTPSGAGTLPDVVVTLTPEAILRAGITSAPVTSATGSLRLRLPGLVEVNAYKQVV